MCVVDGSLLGPLENNTNLVLNNEHTPVGPNSLFLRPV